MSDYATGTKQMQMLKDMDGLTLYRLMCQIPDFSAQMSRIDEMLIELAGIMLERENRLDEKVRDAIDPEQRRADAVAELAAEQGISECEAEKWLEQRAYWD